MTKDWIKKPKTIAPGLKWCGKCRVEKCESEFSPTSVRCRACTTAYNLMRKGVDAAQATTIAAGKAENRAFLELGIRRCSQCHKLKALSVDFSPCQKRRAVKRMSKCRSCVAEYRRSDVQRAAKQAYRCRPERRGARAAWAGEYQKRPKVAPSIRVRKRLQRLRESGGPVTIAGRSKDWATVEGWLISAHGGRCCYCRKPDNALTLDHVIPVSKGGTNDIRNIVPACSMCNSRKNDQPVDVFVGVVGARILMALLDAVATGIEEKIKSAAAQK